MLQIRTDIFRDSTPHTGRKLWLVAWLAWALLIIMTATMPLSNFVGHAHWSKVCWVPFSDLSQPGFLLDAVANVALYAPLGFLGAMYRFKGTASALRLIGIAAFISASGEFFQVFCHNRFPSATDVSTNVLGVAGGILAARVLPVATPYFRRIQPAKNR
jgi:glycopeptide antibiotics resistance protein